MPPNLDLKYVVMDKIMTVIISQMKGVAIAFQETKGNVRLNVRPEPNGVTWEFIPDVQQKNHLWKYAETVLIMTVMD